MRALLAAVGLKPHRRSAGPGLISREEFLRAATDAAARRFDAIDISRSGVISRADIREWLLTHHDPYRDRVNFS